MNFTDLGLCAPLLRVLEEKGYSTPTLVQQKTIPVINEGRDVIAGSQTGTGKTAAFALPILNNLSLKDRTGKGCYIRALILTPTRELATQVEEKIDEYSTHLSLKSAVIFGGVKMAAQVHKLRRGFDVLVATPGRLLDHLRNGTVNLSRVNTFVLDEADRMLDMGFIRDIRSIIAALPKQRQNLLFSATYSKDIEKLANSLLNNPVRIEVTPRNTTTSLVKQTLHPVDKGRKRELISYLIGSRNWQQVLVFTRTKHGANRLAKQLCEDGLPADAIHGNKTQAARRRALDSFKQGNIRVLVATDVAARGIDIEKLPYVVNYDLPQNAEDYIHRIGRTGRAGSEGEAISLMCNEEYDLLKAIERLLKKSIKQKILPGYEPQDKTPRKPQPKSNRRGPSKRSDRPAQNHKRRPGNRQQQRRGRRPAARAAES